MKNTDHPNNYSPAISPLVEAKLKAQLIKMNMQPRMSIEQLLKEPYLLSTVIESMPLIAEERELISSFLRSYTHQQ